MVALAGNWIATEHQGQRRGSFRKSAAIVRSDAEGDIFVFRPFIFASSPEFVGELRFWKFAKLVI